MEFTKRTGLFMCLIISLLHISKQQDTNDQELCNRTVDLVFVIDGSNSLGNENFVTMKNTIARSVDVLNFGPDLARVGAVLYSYDVTSTVPLQTDKQRFQEDVLDFVYPDEATFTDLGIFAAIDILTLNRRENAPMAMMIVTDGASSFPDRTQWAALNARSRGIDIWTVGVSALADMDELARIATNGSRQTFEIETFDLIPDRLINLTRLVCSDTVVYSTFTVLTTTTTSLPSSTPSSQDILTTTFAASTTAETTTQATSTTADTTTTTAASTTTESTTAPPTSTTVPPTTTIPETSTTPEPTTSPTTTSAPTTTPEITTTEIPTTTSIMTEEATTTTLPTTTQDTTTTTAALTTSSSTSDNFTKPPRNNDTPNPNSDLCKNSPSIGGVGYVLYPGDCSKVIQCYYNPITNKTLAVTRQCPNGQFWDQTCFRCVPSWKVDCPYDKCKPDDCSDCPVSEDTYAMDGVCGGYWSCYKGRSYPKCCPPCYSYVAGYGCKFGNTCYDKCGPDDECQDEIGVCDKIPVWENVNEYATATDLLGLQSTTCKRADFSITECRCQVKLMDIFKQDGTECRPYHEYNDRTTCSSKTISIPVKQLTNTGTIAYQIGMNVSTPNFEITSTPSNDVCDQRTKIKIWSDDLGIHAAAGVTGKRGALASVLFKNATGELDITVMLHQGKFTLAVRQNSFQLVSTVRGVEKDIETKYVKLCTDCVHSLNFKTNENEDCLLNKVQLYNCKPEVTDIYITD